MKKILAIVLAVLMMASVVSCGNKSGADISGVTDNKTVENTYPADNGTFTYEYVEANTVRIVSYSGKNDPHAVVIPSALLEGETVVATVVAISDGAFYGMSNINAVEIPNTVTEIGDNAFAGCRGIETVKLPASLTKLGKNTFYNCVKLTTVEFTNTDAAALTAIPESTFNGCLALASINLPATVVTVARAAFFNCASLQTIAMPAALQSVGMQAFQNCSKLASITFGDQIKLVEPYAFEGCTALTSVYCPVLEGWNAVLNAGTEDEEKYALIFASVEDAIDALTNSYFNYTIIRTVSAAA